MSPMRSTRSNSVEASVVSAGMAAELDSYLALAAGFTTDRTDPGKDGKLTEDVLHFWRSHDTELPKLAHAARIGFALSPNSASCERVFALLKAMFGVEMRESSNSRPAITISRSWLTPTVADNRERTLRPDRGRADAALQQACGRLE